MFPFSYSSQEEDIKLKPVIAFDCGTLSVLSLFPIRIYFSQLIVKFRNTVAEIRERDWCNVVTCHMDTLQAYVWRLQNFVLGEHILTPSSVHKAPIKVCHLTSVCGKMLFSNSVRTWSSAKYQIHFTVIFSESHCISLQDKVLCYTWKV